MRKYPFLITYICHQGKRKHCINIHVTWTSSYITGPRKDNFVEKESPLDSNIEKPLQDGYYSSEKAKDILSNLTPEQQVKLKAIKIEHEMICSRNRQAPLHMKDKWWVSVLNAPYKHRLEYYDFFKKSEYNQLNREVKRMKDENEQHLSGKETILQTCSKQTVSQYNDCISCQSMLYGRPFIVDMSFEKGGNHNEQIVQQLLKGYSYNRSSKEPCDIIFTDWVSNSYIFKRFKFLMKNTSTGELMAKMTDQHFIDLYPAKQLVYLSPHATETLTEDHPDNIYILAALVGESSATADITHEKARKEGIRCVKFPLPQSSFDMHYLTLDQSMKIILDIMNGRGWEKAFSHVFKTSSCKEFQKKEHSGTILPKEIEN